MEPPHPRDLRISDADRHRVAEHLREAAGEGRLDLDELEQRLEATYAARTYADLVPITVDLPGHTDPTPGARPPGPARAPWRPAPGARPGPPGPTGPWGNPPEPWGTAPGRPGPPAPRPGGPARTPVTGPPAPLPRGGVPVPGTFPTSVAVMGDVHRWGLWHPGERHTAVALMGSVVLDLREAALPDDLTLNASAVMGSVTVVVDHRTVVEVGGVGVMGSYTERPPRRNDPPLDLDQDSPVVRVRGIALMGSVEVRRRGPRRSRDAVVRRPGR